MNTSTSISSIAPSLLKAQKEIGAAVKDSVNPFFKSNYADLVNVMDACKGPLNKNGIAVLQPVGSDEQGQYVETVLLHETGEFISDKMRLIPGEKPQEQGSAISYARRYGLQSMVFIPAMDDDAELVTDHQSKPVQVTTGAQNVVEKGSVSCADCVLEGLPAKIPQNVYDYSLKTYGRSLCFTHQKEHQKLVSAK